MSTSYKQSAKTGGNKFTAGTRILSNNKKDLLDSNKKMRGSLTLDETEPMQRCFCNSIRSADESHLRCLMRAKKGEKYCPIHLSQKTIKDYTLVDIDILDRDEKIIGPEIAAHTNSLVKKIMVSEFDSNTRNKILEKNVPIDKNNNTMREQKVSTIENTHKENEEDLEIKLLILVNDDEYYDKISELVGPVFKDITLSEDEQDPVTLDTIWKINGGIKIPASVNKYYLFSYYDSKDKIRCLTIFTIYNMIQDGIYTHPITMEDIPESDFKRAQKLIDLYQTKIGLFSKQDESTMSPEFKLKNRLTKLFKRFHIHSIYFEEKWLMSINDKNTLFKIINESEKLVSNNWKSINPNLHGLRIFQKKQVRKLSNNRGRSRISKTRKTGVNNEDSETVTELQEYIVDEWEKLIEASDTPQNQIPIWILASGLSFVVPEVKQKYPDLEIML